MLLIFCVVCKKWIILEVILKFCKLFIGYKFFYKFLDNMYIYLKDKILSFFLLMFLYICIGCIKEFKFCKSE